MLSQIDHIVIIGQNLADLSSDFERLGFSVTPGGEHTTGASHNALVTFTDGTYFELYAFKDPSIPRDQRWWTRLQQSEGLADFALLSDNLETEAARAREKGLAVNGPNYLGRNRPDGIRLDWHLLNVAPPLAQPGFPFMIDDVTPRDLRAPGGEHAQHRNGLKRVAGLTSVVGNLDNAAHALEILLGQSAKEVKPSVAGTNRAHRFDVGNQWIELVHPDDPQSPIGQYLENLGGGPYEVVLTAGQAAEPGQGELLGQGTHGARLRLVH